MSANHLELVKQVAQHLETIIEKTGSLVFWPITWDDSYFLLRELETAVEQIDALSEQLEPIYFDDSFWNDPQNKAFVENIEEADKCFIEFSSHFSRIYSALEEEGPRCEGDNLSSVSRCHQQSDIAGKSSNPFLMKSGSTDGDSTYRQAFASQCYPVP